MRQRLAPALFVLAFASTGCFFARGEVVVEEPIAEQPPVPERQLPPDTGVGDDPLPEGGGSDTGATQVEPQGNVPDPHPIAWESATVDREALTLTLTWWSGVEPCTVLDRVDIDYGDDAVTVTVWEGTPEDAAAVSCIAIAVEKQTTISLDEDIGTRSLVDGATL